MLKDKVILELVVIGKGNRSFSIGRYKAGELIESSTIYDVGVSAIKFIIKIYLYQMSYDYIPVRSSRITLTELMVPSYGNFGGKVHGGHILSMMDKVAYTCASTHSRGYCVTVSVEGVDFLAPIEVGELVSMHASINYVGKSSMVVGIKVVAENFKKGIVKHTNTSYFTMVAMDEESKKPRKVPGLLLESDIDIRRFLEAMKSATLKREYRAEIREAKAELNIDLELGLLEGQNCKIPEVSDIYDRPDRND